MGRGLLGHLGPTHTLTRPPGQSESLTYPSTPKASGLASAVCSMKLGVRGRQRLPGRTHPPELGPVALVAQGGSPVPSVPCPSTAMTSASTRTNPAAP